LLSSKRNQHGAIPRAEFHLLHLLGLLIEISPRKGVIDRTVAVISFINKLLEAKREESTNAKLEM